MLERTSDYEYLNCLVVLKDKFLDLHYNREFMKQMIKAYGEQGILNIIEHAFHKFVIPELDFLSGRSRNGLPQKEQYSFLRKVELHLMHRYLTDVKKDATIFHNSLHYPTAGEIRKEVDKKLLEIRDRSLKQIKISYQLKKTSPIYKEIEKLLSIPKDSYLSLYSKGELKLDCLKEYYEKIDNLHEYRLFMNALKLDGLFNKKLRDRLLLVRRSFIDEDEKEKELLKMLKEEYQTMICQLRNFNDVAIVGNYEEIPFDTEKYLGCFTKYLGFSDADTLRDALELKIQDDLFLKRGDGKSPLDILEMM